MQGLLTTRTRVSETKGQASQPWAGGIQCDKYEAILSPRAPPQTMSTTHQQAASG